MIFRVASGRLNAFINGPSVINSTTTISTGTWTHVAITRSGSTMRQYINGVQDATTATAGAVLDFGGCPVYVGTDIDVGCSSNTGNYYDGRVDEWRAYNRALSAAEIALLASGDAGPMVSGTITLQDNFDVDGDVFVNSGAFDVDAVK